MAAAAAPYAGWLAAAAARAAGASAQAKAVASAFEAAWAATVHPMLVAANRNAFVQLVLSNLFGQNAPAIAAAEAMYEQMWAADVAAMVGYHGGASAPRRRCHRGSRHCGACRGWVRWPARFPAVRLACLPPQRLRQRLSPRRR
ncbi:PPE family protein [Mycobacterium tuberculosis]|nr:PPE family protein [Mycobacterium tuberculosis]